MQLKERQIWKTRGGYRVSVYFVGSEQAAIGSASGCQSLTPGSGHVLYVGLDGKALGYDREEFDLVEYLGYEIDLSNREGVQCFGLWINDCLKSLSAVSDDKAKPAIDNMRSRIKEICEGYPNGLPLTHE
jgi:hypothetical protein